jgi:serine/threonine-protein kinase
MDAARWQHIESICFDALDRSPDTRNAFVAEQCGSDANLRREVTSLLSQIESDPSFLERPIVDLSNPDDRHLSDSTPATVPESIGGYRILRQLGRGGMGEVYSGLHQVEDVQQTVAIKVVRHGNDTDDVLHRFRLERRILAGLNHPNIARLLDAGATEDGRPYFVMEHVEGRPINVYCDETRASIDRRLELFLTICEAVQHAHQNLVVHRDLKPSNILVTESGVPKLLDFGIGKVLDDSDSFGPSVETRTNVRMLTPEYAAPEQVVGTPVTTATDVYALGVLLYEILTGRHPYVAGGESLREIERIVLNVEPRAPSESLTGAAVTTAGGGVQPSSAGASPLSATDLSQLRRRLSGDLDNIVLKALRKEPERRYPSAAALGDDIRKHLRGLPVSARPDTFGYRARKFVRRHAGGVAAVAAVAAALIVTTVVTLVQSGRVTREAARVALERDKALEVQGFLMEMFGAAGANVAVGDTVTARQLLDRQAALLEETYADRPDLKADMLMVLADGYDRLGLHSTGEPLAQEALTIRRDRLGARHVDTAASLNLLGWIIRQAGRAADAEPLLREAVDIRREAGELERVDLSRSLNDLGIILVDLGRHDEAEAMLDEALSIRVAAHGEAHRSVGITANNLAAIYSSQSKLPEAVEAQEVSIRALSATVGPDHQRTLTARGNLATFRYMMGDAEGAIRDYQSLLETYNRLYGPMAPAAATVMISLATVTSQRAGGADRDSILTEAEALVRNALHIRESEMGTSHPSVAEALDRLSGVLAARDNFEDALAASQRAVQIYREIYGPEHQATGGALSRVAAVLWRAGRVEEAVRIQREAAGVLESSVGSGNAQTAYAYGFLCDMLMFGSTVAEDALTVCHQADASLEGAPAAARGFVTQVRLRLAQLHLTGGRPDVADSILQVVRSTVADGDSPAPDQQLLERVTAELAAAR